MRNLVIFISCLVALAAAEPSYLGGAHLAYNAVPLAAAVSSQYHAQDELGQYSYGYSGDTSAKHETRTLDGITRGGYSYLDAHGLVQSASYVSDPVNGFRVAATNLPVGPSAPAPAVLAAAPAAVAVHAAPVAVAGAPLPVADTPEVVAAKLAHFQAHAAAGGHLLGRKRRSVGIVAAPAAALYAAPARSFTYSSVAAHAAPAVVAGVPAAISAYSAVAPHAAVVAAPVVASDSGQYHAQDELGQYSYGYANINSVKHESRAFDGTTLGGYSYVDGHGLVQSVNYRADGLGFRAVGTNIPVGP